MDKGIPYTPHPERGHEQAGNAGELQEPGPEDYLRRVKPPASPGPAANPAAGGAIKAGFRRYQGTYGLRAKK